MDKYNSVDHTECRVDHPLPCGLDVACEKNNSDDTNMTDDTDKDMCDGNECGIDNELAEAYADTYERPAPWERCTHWGDVDDERVAHQRMKEMMRQVSTHGEVHATVEGHSDELEVRTGTARWNFNTEQLTVTTETMGSDITIGFERIISWYKPFEAWH